MLQLDRLGRLPCIELGNANNRRFGHVDNHSSVLGGTSPGRWGGLAPGRSGMGEIVDNSRVSQWQAPHYPNVLIGRKRCRPSLNPSAFHGPCHGPFLLSISCRCWTPSLPPKRTRDQGESSKQRRDIVISRAEFHLPQVLSMHPRLAAMIRESTIQP